MGYQVKFVESNFIKKYLSSAELKQIVILSSYCEEKFFSGDYSMTPFW